MIYIIHFDSPYHHAQHYMGATDNVEKRLKMHLKGRGSRLLRAVKCAGIDFKVVRTIDGSFKDEMKLKRGHNTRRLCPICNPNVSKE